MIGTCEHEGGDNLAGILQTALMAAAILALFHSALMHESAQTEVFILSSS